MATVTTTSWLQSEQWANVAIVLVVDGYNYIATTTDDTTGIATAWAATDWTVVKPGLNIIGTVSESLELFDPSIETSSLTFSLLDVDDTLIGSVLAQRAYTASTYLTASADVDDTTLTVKSTTDFASSGTVWIGHENIAYTGKSSTTFTGCTRGKFALFGTETAANRFGRAHRIPPNTTVSATTAPFVSNAPRTWYNRQVAIYVTHRETSDGAWATKANSRILWAGRIKSWADVGDQTIQLSCASIHDVLKNNVGDDQWTGTMPQGLVFQDIHRDVVLRAQGAVDDYDVLLTLDLTGTFEVLTWQDIKFLINVKMSTAAGISNDEWVLRYSGGRVVVSVTRDTAVGVNIVQNYSIGMHQDLWAMLGNDALLTDVYLTSNGRTIKFADLHRNSASTTAWSRTLEKAPIKHPNLAYYTAVGSFQLQTSQGTWVDQTAFLPPAAPFDTDGCAQIGSLVAAVKHQTSPERITILGFYDEALKRFTTDYPESIKGSGALIREGEDADAPPTIKQVWVLRDLAVSILPRLLLSTGVTDHNVSATWDQFPRQLALGVPYQLVDIPSWEQVLGDQTIGFEAMITKPTPYEDLLLPVLAMLNAAVVFKDGKLALASPGFESSNVLSLPLLQESNKAGALEGADRMTAEHAADGVINRVDVRYWQSSSGEYLHSAQINDLPSIDDHGQVRGVTIKAGGVVNADQLIDTATAPALAYFSRPVTILRRTIDFSMLHLVPGTRARVTDSYFVDPATGTRGVTSHAVWIKSSSFDWQAGRGEVEAAYLPEANPGKLALWGYSARVDHNSGGAPGAGYVDATRTLTCLANYYSFSGASEADAARFNAGDKVRIVSLDEASPTTWLREVESQTGNTIVLTVALSSPAYDTAKRYAVVFDDISAVVSAQRNHAYIADSTTEVTTYSSDPDPYVWSGVSESDSGTLPATQYKNKAMLAYSVADDQDEPVSSALFHHAQWSQNHLLSYKTANVILTDYYTSNSNSTQNSTTPKIVYGPMLALHYGHYADTGGIAGPRPWRVKIFGHRSTGGTSTFVIKSCPMPVDGASWTSFAYLAPTTSATITTTSSSDAWSSEAELKPLLLSGGNGIYATFITVEAYTDGTASAVVTFRGIQVSESNL